MSKGILLDHDSSIIGMPFGGIRRIEQLLARGWAGFCKGIHSTSWEIRMTGASLQQLADMACYGIDPAIPISKLTERLEGKRQIKMVRSAGNVMTLEGALELLEQHNLLPATALELMEFECQHRLLARTFQTVHALGVHWKDAEKNSYCLAIMGEGALRKLYSNPLGIGFRKHCWLAGVESR